MSERWGYHFFVPLVFGKVANVSLFWSASMGPFSYWRWDSRLLQRGAHKRHELVDVDGVSVCYRRHVACGK